MGRDPTLRAAYWHGFRAAAPFILVVTPFALLFGVVGTEAGLNLTEVMGFTIFVIAGASQFAAVQLMTENAPTLVVLGTALAVNLRMAMYSASLAPHLGRASLLQRAFVAYFLVDQSYASSVVEYEERPQQSLQQKLAFFFGAMTPVCFPWYVATFLGATLGQAIPPSFALDFAAPITFLAMIGPMLRTPAHVAAMLVSVTLALLFAWIPYNLGLFVASVAAMMAGARVELLQSGKLP